MISKNSENITGYFILSSIIVSFIALCIFLFSFYPDMSFAGIPSKMAVLTLNRFPRLQPVYHVWFSIMSILKLIAPDNRVLLYLKLFSIVMGTLNVFLISFITASIIYFILLSTRSNINSIIIILSNTSGFISGLFFSICSPVIFHSIDVTPATFHIFITLTVITSLLLFFISSLIRYILAACLIYGSLVIEFPTAILLFPFFLYALLSLLAYHNKLNKKYTVFLAIALITSMLLSFFLTLYPFVDSEGYKIAEYTGIINLTKTWMRDILYTITKNLPPYGWLTILLITILPFWTFILLARIAISDRVTYASIIAHIFSTLCVLIILWNPAFIYKINRNNTIVTPYVFTSISAGYLFVFWTSRLSNIMKNAYSYIRIIWYTTIAAVASLLLLFYNQHLLFNFKSLASLIDQFSTRILKECSGKKFLFTAGEFDWNIMLKAYQIQEKVKVINIVPVITKIYYSYLASLMDNIEYKKAAYLGPVELYKYLINNGEGSNIAVMVFEDAVRNAGLEPYPSGITFLPIDSNLIYRTDNIEDISGFIFEWQDTLNKFKNYSKETPYSEFINIFNSYIARNLVARGMLYERNNDNTNALKLYNIAIQINPENLSAKLNIHRLLNLEADNIKKECLFGWNIWYKYGPISEANFIEGIGKIWIEYGMPVTGAWFLKEASEKIKNTDLIKAKLLYARAMNIERNYGSAIKFYEEVISAVSNGWYIYIELFDMLLRNGLTDIAKQKISDLEHNLNNKELITLLKAHLLSADNSENEAIVLLEALLKENPNNIYAINMLLDIMSREGKVEYTKNLLTKLDALLKSNSYMSLVAKARLAVKDRDYISAKKFYESALRYGITNKDILMEMLKLDITASNKFWSEDDARRILSLDISDPFATYIIGSVALENNYLAKAEVFLKASILIKESAAAWNDLAVCLDKLNFAKEAEFSARRAIELDSNLFNAWDTLGMILFHQKKFDEAYCAMKKALELGGDRIPSIIIHATEVLYEIKNTNDIEYIIPLLMKIDKYEMQKLRTDEIKTLNKLKVSLLKNI